MLKETLRSSLILLIFTAVLGAGYPVLVWCAAQLMFPHQANGSPVIDGAGRLRGSELIGQPFAGDAYFHSRPSAVGYDAAGSGGSNLAPTSRALIERVGEETAALLNGADGGALVPADMVTTGASGLDPHISPAAARFQAARVAAARNIAPDEVWRMIDRHTEQRDLGIFGEPRVNVLLLNLDLDRYHPTDVR